MQDELAKLTRAAGTIWTTESATPAGDSAIAEVRKQEMPTFQDANFRLDALPERADDATLRERGGDLFRGGVP